MHRKFFFALLVLLAAFLPRGFAQTAAKSAITRLSLEELMETEVMSPARVKQPVSHAAAAIFVISQEDIRRSGAKSIPELLRMVPGAEVARVNANSWAVTVRGFNGTLANKLLVLIDGRSVYTPLHSGVHWELQDLLLEDILRIEVIRGPGATLWGANAVNGVINIITKHSRDTQGVLLQGGGGSERQEGALRLGGGVHENLTYRVYGKYFNHDSSHNGNDAWYMGRGGFRSDWQINGADELTFQGDYYNGEQDVRTTQVRAASPFTFVLNEDRHVTGGNLLLRWNRLFSESSDGSLQTYFNYTKRDDTQFEEYRYTYDVEWQHRFRWNDLQEIVWGAGYRLMAGDTSGTFGASFDPADRIFHLYQAFLQDTLTIVEDRLWLTAGVRGERNDFSGFEFQPTARLLWQPHKKHTFWTAFSRAVRTPARLDHDVRISQWVTPGTTLTRFYGDSTRRAEALLAYEGGYRVQIHPRVSLDAAAFYNDYSNLLTTRAGVPFTENGYTVLPQYLDDQAKAETYGTELALSTDLTDWWRLHAAYTFLRIHVHSSTDTLGIAERSEGLSPRHQLYLRSQMTLPGNIKLDTALRFIDRLPANQVPSYWELDVRLGLQPVEGLRFSIVGNNLIHNHHPEFAAPGPTRTEIERAVYAEATLEF